MTTPCCETTDLVFQEKPEPAQMTAEMETLQHMEQQRRACASPTPPNSKGTGNLWFQQGIGTKWKKQFLFSVTTKCGVNVKVSSEAVVEVLYPTGFYSVTIKYINKCPTGPFLAGLTEIETRCYLSREWIWTNLFIAALHIL